MLNRLIQYVINYCYDYAKNNPIESLLFIIIAIIVVKWAFTTNTLSPTLGTDYPPININDKRMTIDFMREEINLTSPACPDRFDIRGIHIGKFISCYDGDTCDIVVMLPKTDDPKQYHLVRYRTRTMGYNAPEIKQPINEPEREEKRKLAVKSRDLLWYLVSGVKQLNAPHKRLVIVDCHGFDKYGRLLVEIYPFDNDASGNIILTKKGLKSINKQMLEWLGPEYEMDNKGRMVHNKLA